MTIQYEPFGKKVGQLKEVQWAKVTNPGQDGESWFVEEKRDGGYSFRVSLSDTQRNSTPPNTQPIGRNDFPTEEEIKKAIARAIQRALVSPGRVNIKPGNRHPITVTCFDLYNG